MYHVLLCEEYGDNSLALLHSTSIMEMVISSIISYVKRKHLRNSGISSSIRVCARVSHSLMHYPPLSCVRNVLAYISKLAAEQIEEWRNDETTSIAHEEMTATTTETTTQTRVETRIEETGLQQPDTALPNNEEEAEVTATSNHSITVASKGEGNEPSEPSDNIPISFEFTPSLKWVNEIQSSMDFSTIQALLAVLAPQVTCVCV